MRKVQAFLLLMSFMLATLHNVVPHSHAHNHDTHAVHGHSHDHHKHDKQQKSESVNFFVLLFHGHLTSTHSSDIDSWIEVGKTSSVSCSMDVDSGFLSSEWNGSLSTPNFVLRNLEPDDLTVIQKSKNSDSLRAPPAYIS